MSSDDELERLRVENHELDAQLKQLVRAERELYVARRGSERQLRQMGTLSEFAIRVSGLVEPPAILDDALQLLMRIFPFEQGLGALATPAGGEVVVVRAVSGCEGESAARLAASQAERLSGDDWPSTPAVLRTSQARERLPGLVARLEHLFAAPGPGPDDALLLAVPLRRGPHATVGVLLLRKLLPHHTFHERLPGDEDTGFLEVLGRHAATAVSNAALLTDLRHSYDQLAAAQAALVDKARLAAVGELSAVFAHEVRNPLGAMFNSLTLLQRTYPHQGTEQELLEILGEEAERLNRLVEDLLSIARPANPLLAPVDLEALLEEAVRVARQGVGKQQVVLTLEVAPGLPRAKVDAPLLRRAVVNLVLNAVHPRHPGPVEVSARLERVEGADFVCIAVRDHGPGMNAELAAKVFQPFFSTRAQGTGLGLTVARRVAEAHGGTVLLETAPGEGATFTLRLPVAGPPEMQGDAAPGSGG